MVLTRLSDALLMAEMIIQDTSAGISSKYYKKSPKIFLLNPRS
jgi:hypothetical protein